MCCLFSSRLHNITLHYIALQVTQGFTCLSQASNLPTVCFALGSLNAFDLLWLCRIMMIKWSRARSITLLERRACQRYLARTRCVSFAGASAWCLSILPALCLLLSRRSFDVESHSTSLHCFFCVRFFFYTHASAFSRNMNGWKQSVLFYHPLNLFRRDFFHDYRFCLTRCVVHGIIVCSHNHIESISSQKLPFFRTKYRTSSTPVPWLHVLLSCWRLNDVTDDVSVVWRCMSCQCHDRFHCSL